MTTTTDLLKAPHIGIREFRVHLSERLKSHKPLIVTDHGEPKKVVLEYQELVELMDTLGELQDPSAVQMIRQTQKVSAQGGKGIPVSRLFSQLKSVKN